MVDFSDREDTERWLSARSYEAAVVIATRAALRAVPALSSELVQDGLRGYRFEYASQIALPTFRGLAICSTVAKFPILGIQLRPHAASAVTACAKAAPNARDSSDYIYAARNNYSRSPRVGASAAIDAVGSAARTVRAAYASGRNNDGKSLYSHAARAVVAAGTYVNRASHLVAEDAQLLSNGTSPALLANRPVWGESSSEWMRKPWTNLKQAMLSSSGHWEVWVDWYEAVLQGWPLNAALEQAKCEIDDEIWNRSPGEVNYHIYSLVKKFSDISRSSSSNVALELVPSQGPGPHFRATEEGLLDRAISTDIDGTGSNTNVVNQLRPLVLRSARDLQSRLSRNEFPELSDALKRYLGALDPDDSGDIEWGEVWGLGVVLQNAASAAQRQIEGRILPELEDPAKTALDSLLTMHGPMILSTRDGAALSDAASTFQMTREQQESLRDVMQNVAQRLAASPDIVTPAAATSAADAVDTVGAGVYPERGTVYGLATIKNISVILIGGAAAATPALIGSLFGGPLIGAIIGAPISLVVLEAIKKNPAFIALVTQLGAKLENMTDSELQIWLDERSRRLAPFRSFVIENQEQLRQIAQTTIELRWMLKYIDFMAGEPKKRS